MSYTFVDLFAGCGGLSTGLELAGFTPLFVSELNSDALETYLQNRDKHFPHLRSKYKGQDIKMLVQKENYFSDLKSSLTNDRLIKSPNDIDLLVGGPPCQGFSGIGIRRSYSVEKVQLPSNHLFQDMAYVVHALRPKIFLFENVEGLLNAKWTSNGTKGEIFNDVLETFKGIPGYQVCSKLIHAKNYGVPQNRPRILVVGVRDDVGLTIEDGKDAVENNLLPEGDEQSPHLIDVLGDLIDHKYENGGVTLTYPRDATSKIQEYFRTNLDGRVAKKGDAVTEHEYSKHNPHVIQKFQAMIDNNGQIPAEFKTKKFAQRLLPQYWGTSGATITATSLPDDFVHYFQPRTLTVREWARLQTFPDHYTFAGKRTTGGIRRAGNPRENIFDRELPKYTQIGNAVPVILAKKIGEHFIEKILNR